MVIMEKEVMLSIQCFMKYVTHLEWDIHMIMDLSQKKCLEQDIIQVENTIPITNIIQLCPITDIITV